MSLDKSCLGIQKQFRFALQALATEAEKQVECIVPGDVPLELVEDYLMWSESYKKAFILDLDSFLINEIDFLRNMVSDLPDSVFEETNLKSMMRAEWQPIRIKAKQILISLNWSLEVPLPFVDQGDGSYVRK